mgnify:CR=1 FL=1
MNGLTNKTTNETRRVKILFTKKMRETRGAMFSKKKYKAAKEHFKNQRLKNKQVMKVDDKVKFKKENQRYTVQACNEKFAICTKPFNPRKTVLYTIIDFEKKIRGAENMVFGLGAETREQCEEMLQRVTNGESEVSSRNWCELDIDK